MNPNSKLTIILSTVFVIILGIVAVVFGIKALNTPIEKYLKTTATVSDVEIDYSYDEDNIRTENHTVYVDYTIDGKEYKHILYGSDTNLKEGDMVNILYNPENPEQIATGNEKTTGVIFLVVGAVAIVGGAVFGIVKMKKAA